MACKETKQAICRTICNIKRIWKGIRYEAKDAFDCASKQSDTDVLWQGYIEYNIARTRVMEYLMDQKNGDEIQNYINEVTNIREAVCFLYKLEEGSYLDVKISMEYESATKLASEFCDLIHNS